MRPRVRPRVRRLMNSPGPRGTALLVRSLLPVHTRAWMSNPVKRAHDDGGDTAIEKKARGNITTAEGPIGDASEHVQISGGAANGEQPIERDEIDNILDAFKAEQGQPAIEENANDGNQADNSQEAGAGAPQQPELSQPIPRFYGEEEEEVNSGDDYRSGDEQEPSDDDEDD